MKIKTKLEIIGILPVAFAVIIGLIIYSTGEQMNEVIEKDKIAGEIIISVFQKTSLRDEYLLNHEERAKAQWYLKQESIEKLLKLASEKLKDPEERVILAGMSSAHRKVGDLFSQLVANYERLKHGEVERKVLQELNERIVGQLLINSQTIVSDAFRLDRATHVKLLTVRQRADLLIVASIIMLTAGIGVASFLIGRSVATPLTKLHEATEIIAKGNLGYEVDIRAHDEVGQLARAFNEMTGNLRKSYEDLGKEIAVRRRTEEELIEYREHLEEMVKERTSQLEAANRELEAFSYSVSHDLRAPLRAIGGFSNVLLEDFANTLDDEGKRFLNIIRDNTKKMGQLIDDLLAFSRLGRKDMSLTDIDVERLAKAVFDELKVSTADRTIQFSVKKLPPVSADYSLIQQVFVNLLSNAIKFTRPKEMAIIEVGGYSEGNENIYYVKDNGVGFDMQYVDKLFGIFQRLHSADEFEGTGVGLAIVQRVIHRHRGRVWAEGKVNEGATFYFSLPIGLILV